MSLCVIFNPTAGGGQSRALAAALSDWRPRVELRPTSGPGQAGVLAAQAVRAGFDTVVAAGGDGTLHEVVNGLGSVPEGFSQTRLGILPLGTMNVFARELGLPAQWPAAWSLIQQGHERRLDLPWVEGRLAGPAGRQYFLQMLGAGVDGRAVAMVSLAWKKRIGWLAYGLAGWAALREPQGTITVQSSGQTYVGKQVLISNGRYYAGPVPVFPQARPDDGVLDVLVMARVDFPALVRGAWGVLTGRWWRQPGVSFFRTPAVTLQGEGIEVEVDGEHLGRLPASVGLAPGALRVLGP